MKYYNPKVVIVGSGAAGLRAAIHFHENNFTDVLVVGDRKFDDAHTTQARGGINAAAATLDTEDNPLIHAVDTFREGQFLANPHLVETLTDNAVSGIEDLIRWGADFHKEDDGVTYTQRFFGAHSYRRTFFSGDVTGKEMIRVMTARSHELDISFLEDTYVYDLKVENGIASGVYAINKQNEYVDIDADIVLFACGGFSNVYFRSSSRNKENFGDAIGIAYRAGATIGDIEMVQFHPTGLLYPEEKFGELVTEAVRGEGGKLFNAEGERFMGKYDSKKLELSTRDVVARANFAEIHGGRGTEKKGVWLDISHKSEKYIKERLPKMHSMILKYNNIDISKEAVEVAPTTHYTMGGIWFDHESYETSLENFYVAGECAMGVHGANRLGGNSLMETIVFGKEIAKAIMKSVGNENIRSKKESISLKKNENIRSLQNICTGTINPQDILTQIRKEVWEYAGIVRVESELLALREKLKNFREEINTNGLVCSGDTYTNIMMYNRVHTVLDLAELICKGALLRQESRGAHYRSDFREMEEKYAMNLLHTIVEGEVSSIWKELPSASTRIQKGLDSFEEPNNYGHSE